MLKKLNTPLNYLACGSVGLLIILGIWFGLSGKSASTGHSIHYMNDTAAADTKVEALKTLTADVLAVQNQTKALQQQWEKLQAQQQQSLQRLKKQFAQELHHAQTLNQQQRAKLQARWAKKHKTPVRTLKAYPVHGERSSKKNFVWVGELSKSSSKGHQQHTSHHADFEGLWGQRPPSSVKSKTNVQPAYTLPVNATLTGATLMTPLVGRIPIDGQLPSPYHFKLILSAQNLTANGYPLPGIQGAVMSGIAAGDLLGRCARGTIQSITFIFQDGTISTTQAKGDHSSLGYLSSERGNPCIPGTLYSDAALFLGGQMGLAAAQGYAHAISRSQYLQSMTSKGRSVRMLIGNANKAALGQAGSAAAQAAQTWWNRRVQNAFDYVYVPNVNPKTGQAMHVAVNITQQIEINHNPNARKVFYARHFQIHANTLD